MPPRYALLAFGSTSFAQEDVHQRWEAWKAAHDRTYNGPNEETKRFAIFRSNIDIIDAWNAKESRSYSLGENRFTDWNDEEYETYLLGGSGAGEKLFQGAPALEPEALDEAPSSFDWRLKGAVTPVKDQGSCGSCWAYSTTGALEGAYYLETGKLVSLSEQEFVDCADGTQGCVGGYPSKAMQFASENDVCLEEAYPYRGVQASSCGAAKCSASSGNAIPHSSFQGYRNVQQQSRGALEAAIAQQPISICIQAMSTNFRHYSGGVLTGCEYQSTDHCILAVGFDTDPTLGDYWIVKNSWGSSWGEDGYARLGRGTGGSYGECGILSYPRYPIMTAPTPSPAPTPPSPSPAPTPSPTPSPSPFDCAAAEWPLASYAQHWSDYCSGGGWKSWAMAPDCSFVWYYIGHAGSQAKADADAVATCEEKSGGSCSVFDSDGARCRASVEI